MSSASPFSLKGKAAIVFGGTSGIGREIALGFASAGARAVLPVSRTREKVDATVDALRAGGTESRGYTADLRELGALRRLVSQASVDFGPIDIALISQGTTRLAPAEEYTGEDYDTILDTNLKSVFFCATEVGRHMLERGAGSIISIASLASYRGWRLASLYAMSKHGVVGMTESLASEWASRGVRVNAIAPGFFLTALNRDRMAPERKTAAIARTPFGRFGELPELVGAAVFLASDASAFVTGETIRVDGGYLAMGI